MRTFLLVILVVFTIFIGTGYFYINNIAQRAIEYYGTQTLGVSVKVGSVWLSPKFDSLKITSISIANPPGYTADEAIEVGGIHVMLDIKSIFSQPLKIYDLLVDKLVVNYEVNGNTNNIKTLKTNIDRAEAASERSGIKADKKHDVRVMINKFMLTNAKADIQIEKVVKKEVALPDITIKDIGVNSGGVHVENAIDQVFNALVNAIARANLESLMQELLKVNVQNFKDNLLGSEGTKDAIEGVSNTLGKMFGQ